MNKKEIKNKVNELLASGTPKSEVFAQLSGQGVKDGQLAYFIASYVSPRLVDQYAGKVNVLVTLMFIQSLIGFFLGFAIGAKMGPDAQWIFGALVAFIPLLFAWGFYKNYVGAYNAYILLSIVQTPRQFNGFESSPVATSIGLAIGFAILAFVWYLQQKLFPDFVFISPKKIKGRYVFSGQANTQPLGMQTELPGSAPHSAAMDKAPSQPDKIWKPTKAIMTRIVVYPLLAVLVVGGAIFMAQPGALQYEAQDEVKRLFSPNFDLPPNQIRSMRQEEWLAEYRRRGYELHCYGNLRPEEQISKDDDYNCWAIIKSAYDNIPSKMLVFWFSKGELQHLKVDFPETSFTALQSYLGRHFEGVSRLDQSSKVPFGKDIYGQSLMVWPTQYGIVVTSKTSTPGEPLTLLWTSKEKLARDLGAESPIPAPGNNQPEQQIEEKPASPPATNTEPVEIKPALVSAKTAAEQPIKTDEMKQPDKSPLVKKLTLHRAVNHQPLDLRHCLSLPSNDEIAKCAEI